MRTLHAGDLVLEPQTAAHADEMFVLLSDPVLYEYLDDTPPQDLAWLTTRFEKLETRRSRDGTEHWLNWVIRAPDGALAGFVQATIYPSGCANIAYELGRAYWGRGWATRSTRAMLQALAPDYGVSRAFATVDRRNQRSVAVLTRLGFVSVEPNRHPHDKVAAGDVLWLREAPFDTPATSA